MSSDPSGFTYVVDVSLRSDNASTRDPCALAATRAEGTSGRDVTGADFVAVAAVPMAGPADAAGATVPRNVMTRATQTTPPRTGEPERTA